MNMKELTTKTPESLKQLIAEKKEALRTFRFGSVGAKAKNVKEGRTIRKDIARMMTVLSAQKREKQAQA
ncbi:MAG: 50S ribosomal protein L29 [Patescibacteria group bacterium]